MILVVDHHDSFTWNLVHALGRFLDDVRVVQCDQIGVKQVVALRPMGIVLAPGPGRPENAGVSVPLVRAVQGKIPLFGVCLGHQVICTAMGARVVRASRPMHGRACEVVHDGRGVFSGLPNPIHAARYNSLLIDPESLPAELVATAFSPHGELMAVRHRTDDVEAVQFHPDSFLTEQGTALLGSFARRVLAAGRLAG